MVLCILGRNILQHSILQHHLLYSGLKISMSRADILSSKRMGFIQDVVLGNFISAVPGWG